MANTLTGLIPTIRTALDRVSREKVGFVQSVAKDSSANRAAVGQNITYPVTGAATPIDITPANVVPDSGDNTVSPNTWTIEKSRAVPIRWNGEEQLSISDFGQYNTILADQIMQAYRALTNEIEVFIKAKAVVGASRAFGTAATTPFGTANVLTDFSNTTILLDDNGAGNADRRMVLSSAAMGNLEGIQSGLFKANEAGTDALLRRGILNEVQGYGLAKSPTLAVTTKGTGASATTDNAGYAVGATTITLASAGTGTIIPGDIITFAGDTNKYVVKTGSADVSAGGTVVLNEPGLKVAIAASATAITVGGNFTPNVAFERSGIILGTRMPALPVEGDMAEDVMAATDPISGLVFEISKYRQFRQVSYFISIAYGAKVTKSDDVALLLG